MNTNTSVDINISIRICNSFNICTIFNIGSKTSILIRDAASFCPHGLKSWCTRLWQEGFGGNSSPICLAQPHGREGGCFGPPSKTAQHCLYMQRRRLIFSAWVEVLVHTSVAGRFWREFISNLFDPHIPFTTAPGTLGPGRKQKPTSAGNFSSPPRFGLWKQGQKGLCKKLHQAS